MLFYDTTIVTCNATCHDEFNTNIQLTDANKEREKKLCNGSIIGVYVSSKIF